MNESWFDSEQKHRPFSAPVFPEKLSSNFQVLTQLGNENARSICIHSYVFNVCFLKEAWRQLFA
jgi:hypothetical protein